LHDAEKTRLRTRHFFEGKSDLPGTEYSAAQEASILRWELRNKAESPRTASSMSWQYIGIYYPKRTSVRYGGTYEMYDPESPAKLGECVKQLLAEDWFSGIDSLPEPIFFDNACFSPYYLSDSVFTENGVTYVDLDLIGASLSLKRYSDD
jgi:hypothetical protein